MRLLRPMNGTEQRTPGAAPRNVRAGRLLGIFLSTSHRQQAAVLACVADGLGLATLPPAFGSASGQSSAGMTSALAAAADDVCELRSRQTVERMEAE